MRKIVKPNGWVGVDKNFQPYRTTGFNQNLIQNDDEEDEMICTELPKVKLPKHLRENRKQNKQNKNNSNKVQFISTSTVCLPNFQIQVSPEVNIKHSQIIPALTNWNCRTPSTTVPLNDFTQTVHKVQHQTSNLKLHVTPKQKQIFQMQCHSVR